MSTNRTIPRAGRSTSLRKTRETLLIHTRRAWPGIRREVLPALAIFWVNLAACGLIFAALEADDNWFLGLYWSAVTGSTTGYGDVLPQSTAVLAEWGRRLQNCLGTFDEAARTGTSAQPRARPSLRARGAC